MSEVTHTYTLPGFKTLLVGGVGTGKTHSIHSLVEAGFEVFAIFTEPGMETVANIPSEKLKWHYIPPAAPSWDDMIDSANKINTMSFEALTKLPHINKTKYTGFIDLLTCLSNFTDDRTGEIFGSADTFDQSRVLFVDSLSGLNIMAMNLVAGSKPVKSMADWGVSMENLERLITKLTTDLRCHVVLTAHLERETDELTGGTTLMASTLGKKLAPRLPRFFSDVIHCKREGAKFSWSTATVNVDLKARNLSLGDNLIPSFVPVAESWRKRNLGGGA
jgi:hypothetical protein